MAWRNIWRNQRRTAATIAAMSVAVFITILYSGLIAGMLVQLESDTLDFELGAAQIFAPGFQDEPSLYTDIRDTDAVLGRLDAAGLAATPRWLAGGLAAHGEASSGAFLRGLDLERDPRVLALNQQVFEGRWLDPGDPRGVVVGRRLAHTLGVAPGDELVVLSQAADGSMANALFRIRGVLKSLGSETDRAGVFMSEAAFRDLMVYAGGAHQIIVGRPAVLDTAAVRAAASRAAPGLDLQSWRELNPTLASMLDSVTGLINVFFFLVNVAIAVVILNATLMAVFERIREFGVLKALGIAPADLLKLIYVESMLQVALAIAIGVTLTLPALWYLTAVGIDMGTLAGTDVMGMVMMETWYAVVSPRVFAQPILMTLLVVSLAVLYPATRAARIQPVDAMRHR
jgi:ABC-type lipoprotein release transport system permease subunit